MKWQQRISGSVLILLVCVLGSGCSQLMGAVKKSQKASVDSDYQDAMKSGELARIKPLCATGKINGANIGFTQREEACAETSNLMSGELAALECPKVDAYWTEAKEVHSKMKSLLHNAYGEKLAKCDRWNTVFVELMHWGQAWDRRSNGYKLLVRLGEAGEPVEDKFLNYLEEEAEPLAIEHSGYAMSHFLKWRLDQKEGKSCDAYIPAMGKLPPDAKHNLLIYFKEEACASAGSVAVSSLSADSPSTRIVACQLLGKVGTKDHLDKITIVADRDGYTKQNKIAVTYPVRDACSQARAKVELRQ